MLQKVFGLGPRWKCSCIEQSVTGTDSDLKISVKWHKYHISTMFTCAFITPTITGESAPPTVYLGKTTPLSSRIFQVLQEIKVQRCSIIKDKWEKSFWHKPNRMCIHILHICPNNKKTITVSEPYVLISTTPKASVMWSSCTERSVFTGSGMCLEKAPMLPGISYLNIYVYFYCYFRCYIQGYNILMPYLLN